MLSPNNKQSAKKAQTTCTQLIAAALPAFSIYNALVTPTIDNQPHKAIPACNPKVSQLYDSQGSFSKQVPMTEGTNIQTPNQKLMCSADTQCPIQRITMYAYPAITAPVRATDIPKIKFQLGSLTSVKGSYRIKTPIKADIIESISSLFRVSFQNKQAIIAAIIGYVKKIQVARPKFNRNIDQIYIKKDVQPVNPLKNTYFFILQSTSQGDSPRAFIQVNEPAVKPIDLQIAIWKTPTQPPGDMSFKVRANMATKDRLDAPNNIQSKPDFLTGST